MSSEGIPSDLTSELQALTDHYRSQRQPTDITQFCANFFNDRLQAQRAQHRQRLGLDSSDAVLSHSSAPTSATVQSRAPAVMAAPTFGGASPFANTGMHSLDEEDEGPTSSLSPTGGRAGSASKPPPSPSSAFGNFGGFGAAMGSAGTAGAGTGQQPPATLDPQSFPSNYNVNRRTSVSAESLNPTNQADGSWTPPFHNKTQEQQSRLQKAVANNFLFAHLDEEQSAQVLGALQERVIPAKGIKVISQGDVGDYFYVVENGTFDIFVNPSGKIEAGPEGLGNKVTQVTEGGSFGELALMYNAPRAATVMSTGQSTLWQLDRVTFRRILMDSAFQRRRMYEAFLDSVPLLSSLSPYERSKIADALETDKYTTGQHIVKEGDIGDSFFMLESGEAEVFKSSSGEKPLTKYKKGDYFGELALLNDAPRAASVVAASDVKVATLGKEAFQRLLGPVERVLRGRTYEGVGPLET